MRRNLALLEAPPASLGYFVYLNFVREHFRFPQLFVSPQTHDEWDEMQAFKMNSLRLSVKRI